MTEPPQDVRMSGFKKRSTVEEAWEWLNTFLEAFSTDVEKIPIEQSYGRCLARPVISQIDVPGFDRSAMDGYAVIADETTGATEYNPIRLSVIGQSMPGLGYAGVLVKNQAVRIMTGAPLPQGASAVVPVEYTTVERDEVLVTTTVGQDKHVGRVGEDVRIGTTILPSGRRLRPQDVAVIASVGKSEVTVRRQPRVRILVTGNELVRAGQEKLPHQIYEANSSILLGTVPRDGGVIESIQFVEDTEASISAGLQSPGADVILVSGGSSVGAEDFAPGLVAQLGELSIHGIAMRPSSPTGLGRIEESLVVLLPGNPVSCLCAYDFFASRAIRRLAGKNTNWAYQSNEFPLGKKIVSAIGRVDYCRIKIEKEVAIPLAISGASILSSTTRADGFVIVPSESEGLPSGAKVNVMLYG